MITEEKWNRWRLNVVIERKRRNLTQAQLAEKLNCHESTLSRLETGNSIPSPEFLIEIAAAIHCSVADLTNGEEL